jgi:hypothetical protein
MIETRSVRTAQTSAWPPNPFRGAGTSMYFEIPGLFLSYETSQRLRHIEQNELGAFFPIELNGFDLT